MTRTISLTLLFASLTLLLIVFKLIQTCRRCESFVPKAHEKTICNSHYMSANPFSYKEDDEKSEFNDNHFNKVFKTNLPQSLGDDTGDETSAEGDSSSVLGDGAFGSDGYIRKDNSLLSSLQTKILNWINTLPKLTQQSSKPFQIYDFKVMAKDKYIFTLYRPNKNHGKVIEADVVASQKAPGSYVIIKMKVIGFINSYDIEAKSLGLNEKKYDSLTFASLVDRWRITKTEDLIPGKVTASAELELSFA